MQVSQYARDPSSKQSDKLLGQFTGVSIPQVTFL